MGVGTGRCPNPYKVNPPVADSRRWTLGYNRVYRGDFKYGNGTITHGMAYQIPIRIHASESASGGGLYARGLPAGLSDVICAYLGIFVLYYYATQKKNKYRAP